MKKVLLLTIVAIGMTLASVASMAAFEAWVINVTATIENALYVHRVSKSVDGAKTLEVEVRKNP